LQETRNPRLGSMPAREKTTPRKPANRKLTAKAAFATSVHLRIHLGPHVALGPGKADLLDGIAATGSIAAAGRRLGMSYKRAWVLIDTMNACFRDPLVTAAKGGHAGGGAALTPLGQRVLKAYRRMQRQAAKAVRPDINQLKRWLLPSGRGG
jgi:molybdate transport system regulatory protein